VAGVTELADSASSTSACAACCGVRPLSMPTATNVIACWAGAAHVPAVACVAPGGGGGPRNGCSVQVQHRATCAALPHLLVGHAVPQPVACAAARRVAVSATC
jgi:hypothetical protein